MILSTIKNCNESNQHLNIYGESLYQIYLFIYLLFIYFEKKVKFLYGLMYRNTLYSYLKDRLNVCDDLAM